MGYCEYCGKLDGHESWCQAPKETSFSFSNRHPYKAFADTVCEVNGFLLDISEKAVPYCWGSSPSGQEMAENGCDACAEQDDCFSASEVKR